MNVAILGPGAVGGFLAALFFKSGQNVQCIAKPETAEFLNKNGLKIESRTFGNFTARPAVSEALTAPADFVFITVKAPFLKEAVNRVAPQLTKDAVIIPLLNGLGHLEILKQRYGEQVVAGTMGALEVYQAEPGRIIHASLSGKIELASDNRKIQSRLQEIAGLIRALGLNAQVLKSEAQVIWQKLVRLNAIACVTAATDKPIGVLRADPVWRRRIYGAVREALAAARLEGAVLEPEEVMRQIDAVQPEQLSSLQRDVSQGRPSELDAIAGAILKKCADSGLPCPTISELYQLIRKRVV